MTPTEYQSWGVFPRADHQEAVALRWRSEIPELRRIARSLLPRGLGRSYGDSCTNDGGTLLDSRGLDRFIAFDRQTGVLRAEAGVTLEQILRLCVPAGWFLPVTPGTKFVTLGGAIANDVHGKNHHRAGTFGRHVRCFELVRSDGQRLLCSSAENAPWFAATIGGMGLTGLMTWAEIQLRKVEGAFIDQETVRFSNLDEFFELTGASDRDFEYTVSWFDCLARGRSLGRGILFRGNHSAEGTKDWVLPQGGLLGVPFDLPPGLSLAKPAVAAFNFAIYHKQIGRIKKSHVPYDPFFYPLDAVRHWTRIYGGRGFVQHQCVLPFEKGREAAAAMLEASARAGMGTFLVVLKTFGSLPSPGMLSFPRPGITLALDFAYKGDRTLRLLDELDGIVAAYHGALYPAKDGRMSAAMFQASYPAWKKFKEFVDPKFSSGFWRRVSLGG